MLTEARSKFSKLYFPGLISLVLLPMLCIFYLLGDGWFQKYYKLEFVAQSRPDLSPQTDLSPKIDLRNYKIYTNLIFTGDQHHDRTLANQLTASVNQLNNKVDTVNGIRISFGNHSKYAEFVNVVDLCHQPENNKIVCMYYEGEFFIWHLSPHWSFTDNVPNPRFLLCGNSFFDTKPSESSLIITSIYKNLLDLWPAVLAFMAMLWFAFSKKRYYLFGKPVQPTQ